MIKSLIDRIKKFIKDHIVDDDPTEKCCNCENCDCENCDCENCDCKKCENCNGGSIDKIKSPFKDDTY